MAVDRMKSFAAKILSTCFGIGFFPVAPGTVTSIAAVLLYFFIPALHQPLLLLPLFFLCTIAGVWSGTVMEESYGDDPSIVTIDELAGQWLALAFLPDGWLPAVLSLVFFR